MVKSNIQNIKDVVLTNTDLIEEINSIRAAIKAEPTPIEEGKALSSANKINFIDSARATFNKYGFDIPKANEDKFITAYEAMLIKPLNDENISIFIGNLEKLSNVPFKEENRITISLFYEAMEDKKYSQDEIRIAGLAEEKSVFGAGSRNGLGLYERAKAIPGLEKAAALLKENIDAGNTNAEHISGKGFAIMSELMPELLTRIDPVAAKVEIKEAPTADASVGTLPRQSTPAPTTGADKVVVHRNN